MLTLAVSACLLGVSCRYDGKSKRKEEIFALRKSCRILAFCPECGCGFPVPRPRIHLIVRQGAIRLQKEHDREDLTLVMELFAAREIRRLLQGGATGFIVKSRSPSCGLVDTPVENGTPGAGLFVRKLLTIVPDIPVMDEKDWENPERREEFLRQAKQWKNR